jgi:hypothetical protein
MRDNIKGEESEQGNVTTETDTVRQWRFLFFI